jgi:uncharacterized protein
MSTIPPCSLNRCEQRERGQPMKFVNFISYVPNIGKIEAVRPLHRAYAEGLRNQGKIVVAGPFRDGAGALIVYETETQQDAEALATNDPFFREGVWARYEIHPWDILGVNHALLP